MKYLLGLAVFLTASTSLAQDYSLMCTDGDRDIAFVGNSTNGLALIWGESSPVESISFEVVTLMGAATVYIHYKPNGHYQLFIVINNRVFYYPAEEGGFFYCGAL